MLPVCFLLFFTLKFGVNRIVEFKKAYMRQKRKINDRAAFSRKNKK